MPFTSRYPDLEIPQTNVLSYLFPYGEEPHDEPIWIDSRDEKNSLSPKSLLSWVRRLALGLERLGLNKGDVVMIYSPNHIFVPVAYLGIVGAGCVFSGANPAYTVSELVHQITNTSAKAFLAHPKHLQAALDAADKSGLPRARVFQLSDAENAPRDGIRDWRTFAASPTDGETYQWPDLTPSEATRAVATINYSSGTTGLPKGVCASHANLIANLAQTIFMRYAHRPFAFKDRPQERWVGFLPLYHVFGQMYAVLMAAKLRVPIYIMSEFRYEDFLATIGRYRITSLQVAPPILVMLSKRPETARYDLSSLREIICGAAPLSRELQNDVSKRFGVQINQGWGMTEVTCGCLHVPGGIGDDTGSVGLIDPNCEVKLVDDDEKEVAVGQPGEMYLRGPNVCLGYWRNEAATRETIDKEGWLKTGDIAVCNEAGYFWIVDRKKELIKVNALQVAPAELEGVLLENEHIADSAVVGVTIGSEEFPRAYVVIHPASKGKLTPKDVQDWIKTKVAKHKFLTGGVCFVDEVPKNPSGKILRKVMREWAKRDAAELGKTIKPRL